MKIFGINTRQADDIRPGRFNLMYFKNHPFFSFPDIWNEFPENLKSIQNDDTFAIKAKKYILDNPTPP